MDGDGVERRRRRDRDAFDDPDGEKLGCRIREPAHVVQELVVERGVKRLPGFREIAEVDDPPRVRIDGAAHAQGDAVAVPVRAAALVAVWHVGEKVGGLEPKLLGDFRDHSGPEDTAFDPDGNRGSGVLRTPPCLARAPGHTYSGAP